MTYCGLMSSIPCCCLYSLCKSDPLHGLVATHYLICTNVTLACVSVCVVCYVLDIIGTIRSGAFDLRTNLQSCFVEPLPPIPLPFSLPIRWGHE
jgi:hypothetical protein